MSDQNNPDTDGQAHVTIEEARQGKTRQGVRWVLIVSVTAAVIAMVAVWLGVV